MNFGEPVRRSALVVLALSTTFIAHACFAASETAELESRLVRELGRLEQTATNLESAGLPEGLQPAVRSAKESLTRVRAVKSPLLRLLRLRDAFISIETLHFVSTNKAAGEDLQKFNDLWATRGEHFAKSAERISGPVLQMALEQAAGNRAQKLYRASLPYSKVSSPLSGLYYLGEGEANLRFRKLVIALPFGIPANREPGPVAARVRRALDALASDTLTTFGGDPAGPGMIPVSARMKEANELADAGMSEGAALLLIESRLHLLRQKGSAGSSTTPETEGVAGSMISLLEAIAAEETDQVRGIVRSDLIPLYKSLLRSPA